MIPSSVPENYFFGDDFYFERGMGQGFDGQSWARDFLNNIHLSSGFLLDAGKAGRYTGMRAGKDTEI